MNSAIVFEDQDIIVVHKPAGIATQTARIGQADVESELKNYRHKKGEDNYIGVIHRLDQPVEGLLVFAKNQASAKKLSEDLQRGILKKYYHALVPDTEGINGDLEDYLLKNNTTNLSEVVSKETKGAKKALLSWKLVNEYKKNDISYKLVQIEIFTGRHHQIRVQMSHANMPLLGDTKYGNENSCKLSETLGIRQTALLASLIKFKHPKSGKEMEFSIPYPIKWGI